MPGTDIAGTKIVIQYNTFRAPNTPIKVRGVPQEVCEVSGNWFPRHASSETAVRSSGNTEVRDNAYGNDPPRVNP